MNVIEMRQKRAELVKQARELLNLAEKENRGLNEDEQKRYEGFMAEIDSMKAKIEQEERLATLEAEMRTSVNDPIRPQVGGETRDGNQQDVEQRNAFIDYLLGKNAEKRAITVGTHGALLPTTIYNRVIEGIKQFGGIRATRATVLPGITGTVNVPVSNDTNKGHRIGAKDATTVDPSSLAVKPLTVYDYTSDVVPVDRRLLEGSPAAVDQYLASLLTDRIAKIVNEETTTGTGTGMPEGLLAAAGQGKVGASATAVSAAEIVDLLHSVPAQFRANAEWMMADSTLREVRKLKNADTNEPLYDEKTNTIMNKKVVINDDMPAMSAGAKSIAFGDFSRYMLADGPSFEVEVLHELYKAKGQVGLVLFSAHGGILADAGNAVKYFKNAAA